MAVSEKTALRHQKWKREILDIIRATPDASRITVKRQRGLSMDSTLALIGELIEENLVISVGKAENGRVGRKATLLRVNDDGCYFIGVRFSAGGVSGASMDFGHRVVDTYSREFAGRHDKQAVLTGVFACVDDLLAGLGERGTRLRGIGVGAPGIIDLASGVMLRYAHIPDWERVPLRDLIAARYGVPTYLEHGVKCTTRAVLSSPEYAGLRDLLFLQIGRGANLCVVTDGRIHTGANYLSGEIGHMRCAPDRTLESLTASDALLRDAERGARSGDPRFAGLPTGDALTLDALVAAADSGCLGARELLARAGDAAAVALAAAVMIVNPRGMLLSGRICASPYFEEAVRRTLRARCIPESLENARLSFLPADPLLDAAGAAMLPYYMQFGAGEPFAAVATDRIG